MTQKQFEETFAARKAAHKARMSALWAQIETEAKEFHKGNAELEELRRREIESDPKKVRKHECYALQHYLGGVLNEWTKTKQLDAANGVVHFDCCSDEQAIFTITIPYLTNERKEV